MADDNTASIITVKKLVDTPAPGDEDGVYTTNGDDDTLEVVSYIANDNLRIFFRKDINVRKYLVSYFDTGSGDSDSLLEEADLSKIEEKDIDLSKTRNSILKQQLALFDKAVQIPKGTAADNSPSESGSLSKIKNFQELIGMDSATGAWNAETDAAFKKFISSFVIKDKSDVVLNNVASSWKTTSPSIAKINDLKAGPFESGLDGILDFVKEITKIKNNTSGESGDKTANKKPGIFDFFNSSKKNKDQEDSADNAAEFAPGSSKLINMGITKEEINSPAAQVIDISNGYTSGRQAMSQGVTAGNRIPVTAYIQFINKAGAVTRIDGQTISALLTKQQRALSGNDRFVLETPNSAFVVPIIVNGEQCNTLISRVEFAIQGTYKNYTFDSFNSYLKQGTFEFEKTTSSMFDQLKKAKFAGVDFLVQVDKLQGAFDLEAAVKAAFIGPIEAGFYPYMTGNSIMSTLEAMPSVS